MQEKLYIGFAEVDITPPLTDGVYLDGYGFRTAPAEGVHLPIFAKVCVLRSGEDGVPFAIFSLDVCGLSDTVHDRLRRWICLTAPIKNERMALCATHTHAGPAAGVLWGLPVNMLYWDKVGGQLGAIANEALSRMVEGTLRLSEGTPFTASANRRGKACIDRRVPVCAAYSAEGKLLGMLVSASCHAVASNDMRISPDYPGVMAKKVSEHHGGAPVLFLQGRGADINPTEEAMAAGKNRPDVPGAVLADCVEAGLRAPALCTATDGKIKAVLHPTLLPYAYPTQAQIEAKIAEMQQALADGIKPRSTEMELLWQAGALEQVTAGKRLVEVPMVLAALSVGGIKFVFLPFELLTSTGNKIEEIFGAHTLVIGYANGTHGYMAPADECGLFDYETCRSAHWYGMPECIEATEQTLLDEVRQMARAFL